MKENEAIKFLLDNGLLFEINRVVLNPIGLALVVKKENENYKFDGLKDNRKNPEDMCFNDEVLNSGSIKFFNYMEKEGFEIKKRRYEKLGYFCQEQYDEEVEIKKPHESREKLFGKSNESKT